MTRAKGLGAKWELLMLALILIALGQMLAPSISPTAVDGILKLQPSILMALFLMGTATVVVSFLRFPRLALTGLFALAAIPFLPLTGPLVLFAGHLVNGIYSFVALVASNV